MAKWLDTRVLSIICTVGVAFSGLASGTEKEQPRRAQVREAVAAAAARHRVDPKLADAVAKVESGYKTTAVSPKGAVGVMQLMPGTAEGLGANPWNTHENIDAGVRYLSMLLKRYNGDLRSALAAYNAGPGAVDKHGGVPPYQETQEYVGAVLSEYHGVPVRTRPGRQLDRRSQVGGEGCIGTEVAYDAQGRMYIRTRSVGSGCIPLR